MAFGSRRFGLGWGSALTREPESVFADKETERASQLISSASMDKYGTESPPAPSVFGGSKFWDTNLNAAKTIVQNVPKGYQRPKEQSFLGGLKETAGDLGGIARDAAGFGIGQTSLADIGANARDLAGDVTRTSQDIGGRLAAPIFNQALNDQGDIEKNPLSIARNVAENSAAFALAGPGGPGLKSISGSLLHGRNPFSSEEKNAVQESNAPVGVKVGARYLSDPATYLGGPAAGVGFAVGSGALKQAASSAGLPEPVQQVAEIAGGILGATIGHNPAAAAKAAERGATKLIGENNMRGVKLGARAGLTMPATGVVSDSHPRLDKYLEAAQRNNVELAVDENGHWYASDPEAAGQVRDQLYRDGLAVTDGTRVPNATGSRAEPFGSEARRQREQRQNGASTAKNYRPLKAGKGSIGEYSESANQDLQDATRIDELLQEGVVDPKLEEVRTPFPAKGTVTPGDPKELLADMAKKRPNIRTGTEAEAPTLQGMTEADAFVNDLIGPGHSPDSIQTAIASHIRGREFETNKAVLAGNRAGRKNLSRVENAYRSRLVQLSDELGAKGHDAVHTVADGSSVPSTGALPEAVPAVEANAGTGRAAGETVQRPDLFGGVTDTGRTETQLNGLEPAQEAIVPHAPGAKPIQQSFDGSAQELPGIDAPRAGQGQPPAPPEPPTAAAGGEPAPIDPATQAVRDYTTAAKGELPGRAQQLSDFKGRQAAAYRDTYDKVYAATGDVTAANAAGRAAQKGATAAFSGGAHLNPEVVPELLQKAHDAHVAGTIDDFEFGRIVDHLSQVAAGETTGSIPGHLLADFEKAFGADEVAKLTGANQPSLFDERGLPGDTMHLPEPGPFSEATPSINRAARDAPPFESNPPAEPTAPGYTGAGPREAGKVYNSNTGQWETAPTPTVAEPPPDAQSAVGRPDIPVQKPALVGSNLEPVAAEIPANPLPPAKVVDPFEARKSAIEKGLGLDQRTPEQVAADAATAAKRAEVVAASGVVPPKPPAEAPPSGLTKAKNILSDLTNVPIATKAGLDLSLVLRQSLPTLAGAVVRRDFPAIKAAFSAMKTALREPGAYDGLVQGLRDNRYTKVITDVMGVKLGTLDQAAKDDYLVSSIVNRGKYNPLRVTNRANEIYIDTLRHQTAESVLKQMIDKAALEGTELDKAALKDAGAVINHGTGRGTGKLVDWASSAPVRPFFSAQNLMAKPQMIADMISKGGAARELAIQQVVGYGGVVSGFLALGAAAGAEAGVNSKPEDAFGLLSGDFGKLRVGPHTLDLSGGFAGNMRSAAQFIASQTGGYDKESTSDILGQWTRGKLSPVVAFAADNLIFHENYDQTPVDWTSLGGAGTQMNNLLGNLGVNDIIKAGEAEGLSPQGALATTALGAFALFGGGMNSGLTPSAERAEERDKQAVALHLGKNYDSLSAADKATVNQQSSVASLDKAALSSGANPTGQFTLDYQAKADKLATLYRQHDINGIDYRHAIQDAEKTRRDQLKGAGEKSGDDTLSQYFALYDDPVIADQLLAKNYDGLDQAQADFTAKHPEVLDMLAKTVGARDDVTRARMRVAQQQAKEYYAIPKYLHLDDAQGQTADKVLGRASSMVTNGQAQNRQDAFARLAASGVSADDIALATAAAKATEANPARKAFARDPAHTAFAEFYKGADTSAGEVGSVAAAPSGSSGPRRLGSGFGGSRSSSSAAGPRRVGLRR